MGRLKEDKSHFNNAYTELSRPGLRIPGGKNVSFLLV